MGKDQLNRRAFMEEFKKNAVKLVILGGYTRAATVC